MMTTPVLQTVSQAMREEGSRVRQASTMASEIVSHSLSGCDSVTDSEVKRKEEEELLSEEEWGVVEVVLGSWTGVLG